MFPLSTPIRLYQAYIFDLDGTIYLGDELLPTSGETITYLRAAGRRTVFISNNPTRSPEAYAARLTRLGIPTSPQDILTSSRVLVDFLARQMPGSRLFVAVEAPLCDEVRRAGFELTENADQVDVVIASFDRTFT
jgi:ribonucleotide monophosphatase NagD (HAD superfamily)